MRSGLVERGDALRYAVLGIFVACCASAATPTTSTNVAFKINDRAAFFIAHLVLEAITHTVIAIRIIYGRIGTRFVEREEAHFEVGLNCKTQRSNVAGLARRRITIECRNHQRKAIGHLITSSARCRTEGGIVRPICFVVLGSPGYRAGCFRTCNGSLTARRSFVSRMCDTPGVALRLSLWRRRPGLSLTRLVTMPVRFFINASWLNLRTATHDSSPAWLANS